MEINEMAASVRLTSQYHLLDSLRTLCNPEQNNTIDLDTNSPWNEDQIQLEPSDHIRSRLELDGDYWNQDGINSRLEFYLDDTCNTATYSSSGNVKTTTTTNCWAELPVSGRSSSCTVPLLPVVAGSTYLSRLLEGVDDPVLLLPDFTEDQIRRTLCSMLDKSYQPDPALFELLFQWPPPPPGSRQDPENSIESAADSPATTGLEDDMETDSDSSAESSEDDTDQDDLTKDDLDLVSPEDAELTAEKKMTFDSTHREYICDICDEKFSSKVKRTVFLHILKHLGLYLYKCEQCDKKFRHFSNFKRHKKRHVKAKHQNNVERQTKDSLTQAEMLSTETEVQVSDIRSVPENELNGKLISFQQALELLKDLIEKDGRNYRCLRCGKECGRVIGNCRDHIWRLHFNVFLYQCKQKDCGRKFRKISDFKDHIKQHQEKENILKELEEKDEVSLSPDLSFHLLTKPLDVSKERGFEIASSYLFHDPVSRKYKCKLCVFTNNRVQGSRNHVLANHLKNVYLFKCHHCGKRFRYENQYKPHMAVHSEGKFVCSQCGKQLVTKRYLIQHERTAHAPTEIQCKEFGCQYKGKTLLQMERHRKVYHDTDRSDWHFCEICAKPFPYINDLKVHLTRCAAGKSKVFKKLRMNKYMFKQSDDEFYCAVCNTSAKSQRSILEHLRRAHNLTDGTLNS